MSLVPSIHIHGRPGIHPAVRLLLLLAIASVLPAMSLTALALIALMLLLVYLRLAGDARTRLLNGLWRMRWLLLAIFVLYAGFTPGTPLLPQLPGLSREGLAEGSRRALVLIDLLVMVYLLLALTPVAELVVGIGLLAAPLRGLGIDSDRIGLRLALALDNVASMHERLRGSMLAGSSGWQRAAQLIRDIEAGTAVDGRIEVASLPLPRWWEWLLPLALLLALHAWTP